MIVMIEIPDDIFDEMNDECLHKSVGNINAAEIILEAAKTKFPVAGETFRLLETLGDRRDSLIVHGYK